MFNGNLKQLFTAMVLEAVANELVPLPKPPVSRQYPRSNVGEGSRRMRQILNGTLKRENGLVDPGQLISRPATNGRRYNTLNLQRPY